MRERGQRERWSLAADPGCSARPQGVALNGARGEKIRDNRKRRCAMGDKGKKDKDKSQKQKMNKQEQKAKRELEKQQKRTP